jgi:hypothetical protein
VGGQLRDNSLDERWHHRRMRVGLAALLLTACAPKPAESLEVMNAGAPPPVHAAHVEHRATAPRPVFDVGNLVPDFHDLLRWPLTAMSHPALSPRFGIAAVFADPGIDWIELCKRGVQNRSMGGRNRDELEYLRGWCSALNGDVDNACDKLVPLVTSAVVGMSPAVRIDVANILVDSGNADKAEHWIQRYHIDDPELLDTLAATYIEVGNERDAWTINRHVMDSDDTPSVETVCRRLVKHIVLSPEGERRAPASTLEKMVASAKVPNTVCLELYRAVTCWMDPANDCRPYLMDQHIDTRFANIVWLQHRWPRAAATESTWIAIADRARDTVPLAGAQEAMVAALGAAERAWPRCSQAQLDALNRAVEITRMLSSSTPATLQAQLTRCTDALMK